MMVEKDGETATEANQGSELIARARGGDVEAMNELLSQFRPLLRSFAQHASGGHLARRMDVSDLVQDTLYEAFRAMGPGFRGHTEGELHRWLQRILQSNFADAVRQHIVAARRSLRTEVSLDSPVGDQCATPFQVASDASTPSQQVIRNEDEERLYAALAELPPEQARAVRMFYFEKCSLTEVQLALNKPTPNAISKLLRRAMIKLKASLGAEVDR